MYLLPNGNRTYDFGEWGNDYGSVDRDVNGYNPHLGGRGRNVVPDAGVFDHLPPH